VIEKQASALEVGSNNTVAPRASQVARDNLSLVKRACTPVELSEFTENRQP
jgi:hypothetical protein